MGLFNKIFKKPSVNINTDGFFEMLTGYAPVFTNAPESLYEMELIRLSIFSIANNCSKLKPEIRGSKLSHLNTLLQYRANPFMSMSQFLSRVVTILLVNNTAFIVPVEDEAGHITGYFPALPQMCEVISRSGNPYLRYTFSNGQSVAIEYNKVGILTRHQYADDFFGSDNQALKPTSQLIHTQNQGIIQAVKNSAFIRFIGKIGNMIADEDIQLERDRFAKENLSEENKSAMLIYDNKFSDVKQIENKPFTINALQMKAIQDNVFNYFGTNENIVQNKYTEDEWNAFYDGCVEPIALQLSLALTNMSFTERELSHGNAIYLTASRLQYASNSTKLQLSTSLFDRGLLSRNGVMDIWSLPHVDNGDEFYIRREYAALKDLGKELDLELAKLSQQGKITIEGDDSGTGGAHTTIDDKKDDKKETDETRIVIDKCIK